MHANQAGTVKGQPRYTPVQAETTWKAMLGVATGKYPSPLRFLYLKSKDNQNEVVTIGYYYEADNIVRYHFSKCRNDGPIKDIFSRAIGRAIVTGRIRKYDAKFMNVLSKEDMYNKFIMIYHPDRKERKAARKALLMATFYENDN